MTSSRSLRLLSVSLVGAAAFLLLAPAAATAQSRAVVLEFGGGRNGAQARRAVVAALDGVVEIVPLESVEAAARAQRVDLATPEGAGAAARAAGAELVISGEVTGRARRARTRLVVRDVSGRELASRQAGPPFGRPAQRALGDEAITMVQEAQNALARSSGGSTSAGGDTGGDTGDTNADDDADGDADDDDADDDDADDDDAEDSDRTPGAAPLFRALAGLDVRTRSAEVATDDGGTRGYDAGVYPELMIALELRPLAHVDGIASGLLLSVEAAHSLGLSSQLEGVAETFGSSSLRIGGALGWLIPFADGAVALGPVLGGGLESFAIDANGVFASTRYTYFRMGLAGRIVIAEDLLALGVSAGYRLVFGVGDIATAFGETGSAYGLDVQAELGGALDLGFAYALRVGYQSYGLSFEGGPGSIAQGVDGSDSALRIQLLVGWQFN